MSSRQLEELMEESWGRAIADELGLSYEDYCALAPDVTEDKYATVVTFHRESPKQLLEKVQGLTDGALSVQIHLPIDDRLDYDEETKWIASNKSDPYAAYINSSFHLGDILAEYGDGGCGTLQHSAKVINRMVFVQIMGAMEAFLNDMLVKHVLQDETAVRALLAKDDDLSKSKFALSDILGNPNLVHETVRKHLQSLIYHNLPKVAMLYKLAFELDIWPSIGVKDVIHKAVTRRHDCVHRDGRTKEGESVQLPTEYVREVLNSVSLLTEHISTHFDGPL